MPVELKMRVIEIAFRYFNGHCNATNMYKSSRINFHFFFVVIVTFCCSDNLNAQIFKSTLSSVHFTSDAPLELIEAQSEKLLGIINSENNTFAFKIEMKSFEGFNSALQRTHFNENYLQTLEFPYATFSGKIIEKLDYNKNGEYKIRAKGQLVIHGVSQERIIKSNVQIKDQQIFIQSDFSILLKEHNISIPKIVYQKIAEEIQVKVNSTLEKSNL